jgi:hypothetical protein
VSSRTNFATARAADETSAPAGSFGASQRCFFADEPRPSRQLFIGRLRPEMNLEKVEARVAHRAQFVQRRLDRHRDPPAIRETRSHRAILFERDVPRRFRIKNEPEVIGAAAIGELRVDERRQPAHLESDAVDHVI